MLNSSDYAKNYASTIGKSLVEEVPTSVNIECEKYGVTR